MGALILDAVGVSDPAHWSWLLRESSGPVLARKRVALDTTGAEYEAFADLHGYLRWRAAPDRKAADEAVLVTRIGQWIGREVFGPVGTAIAARAVGEPLVVRVRIPAAAGYLLTRPFELAYVDGLPLACRGVSLVYETPAGPGLPSSAPHHSGGRLRMLAVFSLPTDAGALAVRRERQELVSLIRRLSSAHGAVELRVLQYGATRDRLGDALGEEEGWDIVHISGHGLPGGLYLEHPDGSRDLIGGARLARLLAQASPRLKLVTLSACDSAADSALAQLRQLGLAPAGSGSREGQRHPDAADIEPSGGQAGTRPLPLPALAAEVARHAGCAVLAMRYPVDDEFAVRLTNQVYGLLLGGLPLPACLQGALKEALRDLPPALSVATPALFGSAAAGLVFEPRLAGTAADSTAAPDVAGTLPGFPPAPVQFVGHAGTLVRASAALAPRSGRTGVLLYGMAGLGKTSCALEVAHAQRDNFSEFFYHALPDVPADLTITLYRLLMDIGQSFGEPGLADLVRDEDVLRERLAVLAGQLNRARALIVLDNLECLLTPDGDWRDGRCSSVIEALTCHRGSSRVILASRFLPRSLDQQVLPEPVQMLSPTEAMLMARELPNLRSLLDGPEGPAGRQGRSLAKRVLKVVQGHPMLIKLADRQAADPAALTHRLREAEKDWGQARSHLDVFFGRGIGAGEAADYLRVLTGWTQETARTQPVATVTGFQFLSCLEEEDRYSLVPAATWTETWHRAGCRGQTPDLHSVATPLITLGLVSFQTGHGDTGYRIHPAVAQAARAASPPGFRDLVDKIAADYWQRELQVGQAREPDDRTGTALRAARRALPYLVRVQDWNAASIMLRQVLDRDSSPATVAALLPLLQDAADGTAGTGLRLPLRHTLIRALAAAQPPVPADRLSQLLSELLDAAVTSGDLRIAAEACGDLADLALRRGQTDHALRLADREAELIRTAQLGRWSQAANELRRLRIDLACGRDREVFTAARRLLETISTYPDQGGPEELAHPWSVREGLLAAGIDAADNLKRLGESLVWNAARVRSMERRGAPPLETARAKFEAHYPLLCAYFIPEARRLVLDCRAVFEREHDSRMLGLAFGAMAWIEEVTGRISHAIRLEREALRHACAAGNAAGAARSYENLADYLTDAKADPRTVLAHRLAGAVTRFQANSRWLDVSIRLLARDLSRLSAGVVPPAGTRDLLPLLGETAGAGFERLMDILPRRAEDSNTAIAAVLALTQSVPAADREHIEPDFAGTRLMYREVAQHLGAADLTRTVQAAVDTRASRAEWKSFMLGLSRARTGRTGACLTVGLGPADAAMADFLAMMQPGQLMPGAPDLATHLMPLLAGDTDPDTPQGLVQVAEAMLEAGPGRELATARRELTRIAESDDRDITLFAILLRHRLSGQPASSLTELTAGLETPEAVVADIMASLGEIAEAALIAETVREHAPLIKAMVAEANGDTAMSAGLGPLLAEMVTDPGWEPLARALYKVLAGERSPALARGLEAADAAIVNAVLHGIDHAR